MIMLPNNNMRRSAEDPQPSLSVRRSPHLSNGTRPKTISIAPVLWWDALVQATWMDPTMQLIGLLQKGRGKQEANFSKTDSYRICPHRIAVS
jgi:hypothetical protein